MWRMQVTDERQSVDGKSVEVPTHEKTNSGKGSTMFIIRDSPVENWSVVHVYHLLREGAKSRGVTDTLWCSDGGVKYSQSSFISRMLKRLLGKAGIPAWFAAYSIRHALITYLFGLGATEVEVNAYTGHSNNSHTALNHYFHLDEKWMGNQIGRPEVTDGTSTVSKEVQDARKIAVDVKPLITVSEAVKEETIRRDNELYRQDEGEEVGVVREEEMSDEQFAQATRWLEEDEWDKVMDEDDQDQ
jgi:hypothetical protein